MCIVIVLFNIDVFDVIVVVVCLSGFLLLFLKSECVYELC